MVFVDGLIGFGTVPGCVNSAIAGEFVRGGSLSRFFFFTRKKQQSLGKREEGFGV